MLDEPSLRKALTETGEARAEGMKDSKKRTLWSWVDKGLKWNIESDVGNQGQKEAGPLWKGAESCQHATEELGEGNHVVPPVLLSGSTGAPAGLSTGVLHTFSHVEELAGLHTLTFKEKCIHTQFSPYFLILPGLS